MNLIECLTPWNVIINQFTQHACGDVYTSGIPTEFSSFFEYLIIFLKTYLLELPVYYFFLRKFKKWNQILLINILINLATHPFIYLALPLVLAKFNLDYLHYLALAEIYAPSVEMLLLLFIYKINWRYALISALLANLFSWSIGIYWS